MIRTSIDPATIAMNVSRVLPFAVILVLAGASAQSPPASQPQVPANCPITRPSDHPFVPPFPYPPRVGQRQFWYGTDRLWTSLPVDGTWAGLPHYTPSDPTF